MAQNGGGGLFVETHPFPHVFTPLSPECSGALILGFERKDGLFDFAAFEVPFGYTMKIGSNVIHGDSFFVGPYAIALTDTELADSVLFKKDNVLREIQPVIQSPTPIFHIPLSKQSNMNNQLNEQIIQNFWAQYGSFFNPESPRSKHEHNNSLKKASTEERPLLAFK